MNLKIDVVLKASRVVVIRLFKFISDYLPYFEKIDIFSNIIPTPSGCHRLYYLAPLPVLDPTPSVSQIVLSCTSPSVRPYVSQPYKYSNIQDNKKDKPIVDHSNNKSILGT